MIAGTARGVRLAAPGPATRPLADRAKEAVFGALAPSIEGAAVLDLCAGSGAAGIEALSRGARSAVLVERDGRAAAIIAENLRRTGLVDRARVIRRDAVAAVRDLAAGDDRFDLAIVDPPYADTRLRDALLGRLGDGDGPLAAGAVVVVTAHWRDAPPASAGLLRSVRVRRFGETAMTFYRYEPSPGSAGGGEPMRTAVYPGSFDPVTLGHIDVLRRAAGLFDRVVLAVLVNPRKAAAADAEDRASAVREAVAETLPDLAGRIEVQVFDGLTVEACRDVGASHIVRGLRAVSDFEAELQMAHMNRRLAPEIDTLFFMTALEYGYLSSSLVKEIARFGGDVSAMVPANVAARLGGEQGSSGGEGPRL